MKISIAVPSHNYSKFLEICLESIRTQDYHNYEVLIADGGSTDGSVQVIKRFCEIDDRFRLISDKDNGQSDAINKAFSFATGDIYCYLNADDHYLCRTAFSSVALAFNSFYNVDVVSFGGYYTDSYGRYLRPVRYRYHPLDSIALMKYRTAVLQPATFWRRHVQEALTFNPDFHYCFDAMFFYEVYSRFSWLELSKPIAGYRLHGINKSLQIIPERIFEIAKFEQLKFGALSIRPHYIRLIGLIVVILVKLPIVGKFLCRLLYKTVNVISFLTVYRLPGI
jgi:glycosyltransferase involved in cell wall biosynthesis